VTPLCRGPQKDEGDREHGQGDCSDAQEEHPPGPELGDPSDSDRRADDRRPDDERGDPADRGDPQEALMRARCARDARGMTGPMLSDSFPRHGRQSVLARWAGRIGGAAFTRARPELDRHIPQPAGRADLLTNPVAISERCVIGDQICLPATSCDVAGCQALFADPAALGAADNRARALTAGWAQDAFGRGICPTCQQRHLVASAPLAPRQIPTPPAATTWPPVLRAITKEQQGPCGYFVNA